MKRDPDLGRLLEAALPSGVPSAGAEERLLERIRAAPRTSAAARPSLARRWLGWALAAILLLTAGFQFAVRLPAQTPPAGSPRSVAIGASDELLLLEHGVRVLARSGARVDLMELADRSECRLQSGMVLVHVPEGSGRRFEVVTPSSRVLVTGTVFSVEADAEATGVTVWDGHVQVIQGDVRTSLGAGQHWPLPSTPAAASDTDFELIGASSRLRGRAPSLGMGSLDAGREMPVAERAESSPPAAAQSLVKILYARARELERAGQRTRAASVYERVSEADGADAEAASFAAARLYGGMANHGAAQRVLLEHRARYADGGAYGRAADVLLLRTYVAQGNAVQIEREAERFILHHPSDPRAAQFRAARALVWAKRGRCGEAQRELPLLSVEAGAKVAAVCSETADTPPSR